MCDATSARHLCPWALVEITVSRISDSMRRLHPQPHEAVTASTWPNQAALVKYGPVALNGLDHLVGELGEHILPSHNKPPPNGIPARCPRVTPAYQ